VRGGGGGGAGGGGGEGGGGGGGGNPGETRGIESVCSVACSMKSTLYFFWCKDLIQSF